MANSLASALPSPQRTSLRMRGETVPTARRNDEEEFRALIGRAIESALRASNIDKKAAARDMGYGDNHASISNWISGKESPQFARLWRLGDRFREELVIALAVECGTFDIRQTLERRRA